MQALALALAASLTFTTANSTATGDQDTAAIATNRYGQTAVVWEDNRDGLHDDVWIRLFTNGAAKYETKLSAGGSANWTHLTPDVGIDDSGNAVVVWAEDGDGNGVFNIQYRVISPAGTVTASGRANAGPAGDQILPKVAVDPDGAPAGGAVAFTVVWEDVQSGVYTVKAAGYTGPATKAYEVFASQQTGQHHRPDVAVDASGDARVVWDEDADANGYYNIGLVGLARANGAVNLSRRTANSLGDGQQRHAAIAEDFTGGFAVAWESDHTGTAGVWTRSFAPGAVARGPETLVADGGTNPAIGVDAQHGSVVAWTAGQDVWAQGSGFPAQRSSQVATGRQEQIGVAVDPWGGFSVAYTDDSDGNGYDQVILGTGGVNSGW
ncbi:hypothetical protein Dvina_06810 [Dactylosporangium vinaceum]|uniref:Uncharacterized protein n=1 Tax=Dactylosporangium vinaceum TaxID=53362 RepID=A0ABV5M6D7_9ACTN|nr:hypothetical protein [Dactylosporangium vinaceum]UAB97826.1 hypothetical protein Dvina_06810 [Dactylosporangium vinaceum]